jgi:multidrug resistance efflux pump
VAGTEVREAKSNRDVAQATVEELRNRADSLALQEKALTQRRDALALRLELLTDERQAKDEHEAKCKAAEARAEQARVALAEAKLRLDRMTIRAPVDGRIYQLVAYPGSTLSGGMGLVPNADGSTVVTMYQPNMMQVRVDARFEDIPKVSLGQPVQINNPALDAPVQGKVLFVSSEANIQKNTHGRRRRRDPFLFAAAARSAGRRWTFRLDRRRLRKSRATNAHFDGQRRHRRPD